MGKIYIVGIGMGNHETLTFEAHKKIQESNALIGAKRMIDSFDSFQGTKFEAINPKEITDWILNHKDYDSISVLMSGDVGFFSGAKKLVASLEAYDVELIPGISSLQYFCAKLKVSWEDIKILSLHGRDANLLGEVQTNQRIFLLTGTDHPVNEICKELAEADLGQLNIFVGERLSYAEERITKGTCEELKEKSFHPLSVMVIENPKPMIRFYETHGLEDELFLRGKVPMTKSEVRSVTLSKLCLHSQDIIYDIGAGTGSVSIEMALQANKGQIYAIETNLEAIELIKENKEKFGTSNLHIISGMAPEALHNLPVPDKAFIGGTKGNLEDIISVLLEKNPNIHIVMNGIALETISGMLQCLKKLEFEFIDVVQIFSAKGKQLGDYHLMTGQNPVYIISCRK